MISHTFTNLGMVEASTLSALKQYYLSVDVWPTGFLNDTGAVKVMIGDAAYQSIVTPACTPALSLDCNGTQSVAANSSSAPWFRCQGSGSTFATNLPVSNYVTTAKGGSLLVQVSSESRVCGILSESASISAVHAIYSDHRSPSADTSAHTLAYDHFQH